MTREKTRTNKQLDNLMERVVKLMPEHQPRWGSMKATEMLMHCNITNRRILEWDKPARPATIKQKILKFVALKLLPHFPKNVKTAPQFETKGKIDKDQFEQEKKKYLNLLIQFKKNEKPLSAPHPFFGPLNTGEWNEVLWKHLDHHLRQFRL